MTPSLTLVEKHGFNLGIETVIDGLEISGHNSSTGIEIVGQLKGELQISWQLSHDKRNKIDAFVI